MKLKFRLWEGNQEPAWTGAAARKQHWKTIGWTKKASERLFTDLDSLWTEQLNIIFTLTWQIIVMNQIQLEFMATLTVSLGGAHIRNQNHVCAEWDLKVIKKIDWVLSTSVSPWCDKCAQKQYLVEPVCQFSEPLLCRTTTMLSYYAYATMLSHLRLLSESRRLIDTHFLPSPYHFLAPRTQGNAQSTPSTICCSSWHTTTITWSLPVLEN